MLKVGDKVKDFTLLDFNGKSHTLSNHLGKKVVVYFYPKDKTPGCTKQACDFRDNFHEIKSKNVVLIGISPDGAKSHERFINKFNLPFILLSDETKEVATYFGAYGEKVSFGKKTLGIIRSTYLIDENDLANLLLKVIDELHTSYCHPSHYNKFDYPGFKVSLGALGPRVNNWYQNSLAVGDAIELKWGSEELRPDYWFLNGELEAKTHAVLTLDEFATSDLYESATFDNAIVQKIMKTNVNLLPATTGTRFFFYNNSSTTNNTMEAIIKGAA